MRSKGKFPKVWKRDILLQGSALSPYITRIEMIFNCRSKISKNLKEEYL